MLNKIDIKDIKKIALDADKIVMKIYRQDLQIEYKDDCSPLTEADVESNKLICSALKKLYPNLPILSEENKEVLFDDRKYWEFYWCIDPIDGTKEFIKKNDEFTINISLIHKDKPVLGVVYAPALGNMYYAKIGEGTYKEVLCGNFSVLSKSKLPLTSQKNIKEKITVIASKSHLSKETQKFIDNLSLNTKDLTLISKGSSLKFCMVAEGEADIYPRLAPTMEWDTAAADTIVRESGKMTYQFESNEPLLYNKKTLLNPWFVVK